MGVLVLTIASCSDGGESQSPSPTSAPATSSTTAVPSSPSTTTPTLDAVTSPTAAGFDTEQLAAGLSLLAAQDSNAHRIVARRAGVTAVDIALWPSSDDQPHDLASLTKSVVSLVVGAAVERGDIASLDAPMGELLTTTEGSEVAAATLRDVLRMRSGLDCALDDGEPRLEEMLRAEDFVAYAAAIPAGRGTDDAFAYCSPAYHLVSAAIGEQTGQSLEDYARATLFEPLGIEVVEWAADAQGVTHGWGDLRLRATDLGRIGDLVLADGVWEGRRVLPAGYVDALLDVWPTDDPTLGYGMGWWVPTDIDTASEARVLEGIGRGGQSLLVWPDEALVVVVTGAQVDGRLITRTLVNTLDPSRLAPSAGPAGPDDATDSRIAAAVAALGRPPSPTAGPGPAASLPIEVSADLTGNPLGITHVEIVQTSSEELVVTLRAGGSAFRLPIGLDGVARPATETPTGLPVHLLGTWDGDLLRVDYEETFGPEHWTIEIDLAAPAGEGTLAVTVTDLGGGFPPISIPSS